MKTSAVRHPQDDYYIIVRRWQRHFCADHEINEKAGPSMLSLFEYFHNLRLEQTRGKDAWQYHSVNDIVERIQGLAAKNTVRETKDRMEEIGLLEIRENSGDKPAFRLNVEMLNNYIEKIYNKTPPKMEGYPSKNGEDPSKNGEDPSKNGGVTYKKQEEVNNNSVKDDSFFEFKFALEEMLRRNDKPLRVAVAASGCSREDFISSFTQYCFQEKKSFLEAENGVKGLPGLLNQHAVFLKGTGARIKPDHTKLESIAQETINWCYKNWKKTSGYHDYWYGRDKNGKNYPKEWFDKELQSLLRALTTNRLSVDGLELMKEAYKTFYPDFGYSWQAYDGNWNILTTDLDRAYELQKT